MDESLKQKLQQLAAKYEVESFTAADPSQFLHWYDGAGLTPAARASQSTDASSTARATSTARANTECAAFIAAMLAFGSRTQFIPKIRSILELADQTSGSITAWLLSAAPGFPTGSKKFYRFYSNDNLRSLFSDLADILRQSGSLGEYLKTKNAMGSEQSLPGGQMALPGGQPTLPGGKKALPGEQPTLPLDLLLANSFPNARIVPKGCNSANKRIHMFLRWMVRTDSPVDLGLWTWVSPAELLIPLDVHVMQEAVNLGLLPPTARATRKTAVELTRVLEEAFPGDPVRADYALFGLGIDE